LVSYDEKGNQRKFPFNSGLAGIVVKKKVYSSISNAVNHNQFNGLVDIETNMPLIIFPIKVDN